MRRRMRRAMEYVRWELARLWGRRDEVRRSIYTGTKTVANLMWLTWKRGAMCLLVLASLPILCPVLFLSILVGVIFLFPILCGVTAYYILFHGFSLPSCITIWYGASLSSSLSRATGSRSAELQMLQETLLVYEDEIREPGVSRDTSSIAGEGTEELGRVFGAETLLLLNEQAVFDKGVAGEKNDDDHIAVQSDRSEKLENRTEETGVERPFSFDCQSNAMQEVRELPISSPCPKERVHPAQLAREENVDSRPIIGDSMEQIFAQALRPVFIYNPGSAPETEDLTSKVSVNKRILENQVAQEVAVLATRSASEQSIPSDKEDSAVLVVHGQKSERARDLSTLFRSLSRVRAEEDVSLQDRSAPYFPPKLSSLSRKYCKQLISSEGVQEREGDDKVDASHSCEVGLEIVDLRSVVSSSREVAEAECPGQGRAAADPPSIHPYPSGMHYKQLSGNREGDSSIYSLSFDTEAVMEMGKEAKQEPISEFSPRLVMEVGEQAEISISESPAYRAPLTTPSEEAHAEIDLHWSTAIELGEEAIVNSWLSEKKKRWKAGVQVKHPSSEILCHVAESVKMRDKPVKGLSVDQEKGLLSEFTEGGQFPAVQALNLEQRRMTLAAEESGPSTEFVLSPFIRQRRLSFSEAGGVIGEGVDSELFYSEATLKDHRLDTEQRSISTTFSSEYAWLSESSEQAFDGMLTLDTADDESIADNASSTTQCEEQVYVQSDSLAGPFGNNSKSPPICDDTPENWQTCKKRWEEESTPGELLHAAPNMEPHSSEARLMCNPLFEFSTPSQPAHKSNVGGQSFTFTSTRKHTRSKKRRSAPEILRTQAWLADSVLSPPHDRFRDFKKGKYTARSEYERPGLAWTPECHARSYSASLPGNVQPYLGDVEGLLEYWREKDKHRAAPVSSPEDSATMASPAEVARQIREEINTIQRIIGQEIPPQYSLCKEVEILCQILGMQLPYMGDLSDLSKAMHGLDLLRIVVGIRWDVG